MSINTRKLIRIGPENHPTAINPHHVVSITMDEDSGSGTLMTVNGAYHECTHEEADDAVWILEQILGWDEGIIEKTSAPELSGAEIKTLYEAEPNTNAFTDEEKTKLADLGGVS